MKKITDNKRKIVLLILVVLSMSLILTGCAEIMDKIAVTKGNLVGQHFNIAVYDNYALKTMSMEGSRVSIEVFEDRKSRNEDAVVSSSVLEITVNGEQIIQSGNTIIFAEDGLDMVEDFEIPSEIKKSGGMGFVPVDRYVNDIKNKIGKEKTVVILTPLGVPIGVYEGKNVYVTVPKDLPKMTRLNIDGKSLYIHRANYIIMDTKALN